MEDFKHIILDSSGQCQAYYTQDGMYRKADIISGGKIMEKELKGFQCFPASGSIPCVSHELSLIDKKALRISKKLGDSIAKETKIGEYPEVTDGMAVLYDPSGACPDRFIEFVKNKLGEKAEIIYIMPEFISDNSLLSFLSDNCLERLTVITGADVLRRMGMDISCGLSWENTVSDLVWQVYAHSIFRKIADKGRLIVRLAAEGAAAFNGSGKKTVTLSFIPESIEGDLFKEESGKIFDLDAVFASPLIDAAVNKEGMAASLEKAVMSVNGAHKTGYCISKNQASPAAGANESIMVRSMDLNLDTVAKSGSWTLLEAEGGKQLEKLAKEVVLEGVKKLSGIPSARFGFLVTVDRNEIERFRAIRNIMEEYLKIKNPPRPLSIAVFGKPGSGKSFGVTQIAKCIGKDSIEKVEFNLSQLTTKDDLTEAYHKIRDLVLKGKVPLVFFDEFDSGRDGEELAWLKSFLAPMQDGEFTQNGRVHPIGKCIFIFAGGVFTTFDEFCEQQSNTQAKVRDFISRLKGYINIQGPNPNPSPEEDSAYTLRRAVLLRSMIDRKLRQVKSGDGCANVDEDIVKAMLRVPEFRHGARSMESIIDMSMVFGKDCWDKSDLPPTDQLAIHVDQMQFKNLLLANQIFAAYREDIARAIHENYRTTLHNQSPPGQADNPNDCQWSELSDEFKEDNKLQADDMLEKLIVVNCSIEPESMSQGDFAFTEDEIELLGIREHDRWMKNKILNGWTYGKIKDVDNKKSPYILPWEELDENTKELDRDPIRNIPSLLKTAGLGVYRVK